MYLHTRLLIGILAVTFFALCASAILPFASANSDVSRETDASLELANLLLDVDTAVRSSGSLTQALAATIDQVRRAEHLRHVRITLVDPAGAVVARTPTDEREGGWIARELLPPGEAKQLSYPINYRGTSVGVLHLYSNPLSELAELEDRVFSDLILLAGAILAMAVSMYWMVRRGLKPISQINSALTRLADGVLDTRLPHFRLRDLDEISSRFNHCAGVLQETAAERRELTRRLINVGEEERTHVARELHDELGQILTAVKVDAAYIVREAKGRLPKVETCARGIEELTTQIMELVRGILARLRPHGLETMGLRAALEELVNGWKGRIADRFDCSFSTEGPVNSLSDQLNITLYRLIQECLTNAVRHSRARSVSIRLIVETNDPPDRAAQVRLYVTESKVVSDARPFRETGAGILGMRERVESHGGKFKVHVHSDGGISLEAWMPLRELRQELADA
jgi:signal transduction histidine kinase